LEAYGEILMTDEIIIENLNVKLNGRIVLENINFRLKFPRFIAIMGPNGAGKTTLLKVLTGFIKPYEGEVSVYGLNPIRDKFKLAKIVGYVPQRERIEVSIPMKVKDVVLMGLLCKRRFPRIPRRENLLRIKKVLEAVGIEELYDRIFSHLSGGEQQKVLIARALISNPRLLILDEPLTAIDVKSQWEIIEFLKKLELEEKIGILMVTHDINPVVEYVDEVLLLNRKLIAYGEISKVLTEENLRKAYGPNVRVVTSGKLCYAITGDIHA